MGVARSKVISFDCLIIKLPHIYIGVFPRFPRFSPHPFQVRNPKEGQDDLIAPLKGACELEQGGSGDRSPSTVGKFTMKRSAMERLKDRGNSLRFSGVWLV